MPSLMSMEDLFYGPAEPTYILPTPDDDDDDAVLAPAPCRYIQRDVVEPLRPVVRYVEPLPPAPPATDHHHDNIIRPIERLARIHTAPEPVALRTPHEEIRKVVEVPVPVPVEVEPLRPAPPAIDHHHDNIIRPIERLARIHTAPEPVPLRAPHEEIPKVVEVPVPVPVEVEPLRPAPPAIDHHHDNIIRPIERLARIHTAPEPVPLRAPHEEIPKVVEVPVPVPVEVHVPAAAPVPPPPPPVDVVKRSITPPIQPPLIHHPIELKVPMCCEKCAKKVKDRLLDLEGVTDVVTDQYNQKVTVYGDADPARLLNRVKLVKKRSAFWDLTVDYTEHYRQVSRARAEASARAEAESRAAKAESSQPAKLVAPRSAPIKRVVQLPQERIDGPAVTAILPDNRQSNAMPAVVNSRIHSVRYVSPPKAYYWQKFYNGRHAGRHPSSVY